VILDFDDTLCMTEEACLKIENEALKAIGREPMSREIHKSTWGKPLFEAIELRSPGVDVKEFKKVFLSTFPKSVKSGKLDYISEHNLKALDKLIGSGKTLLVLTSRIEAELAHVMSPSYPLYDRIETFYYKWWLLICLSDNFIPKYCLNVVSYWQYEDSNSRRRKTPSARLRT
jgi:phosphoglycolate phosphatase